MPLVQAFSSDTEEWLRLTCHLGDAVLARLERAYTRTLEVALVASAQGAHNSPSVQWNSLAAYKRVVISSVTPASIVRVPG